MGLIMSTKAIALVEQHPDIQEAFKKMDEVHDNVIERMKFIKTQAGLIETEYNAKKIEVWHIVEKLLADKGLMPKGYDSKNHNLRYNRESGVIYWETQKNDGLPDMTGLPE